MMKTALAMASMRSRPYQSARMPVDIAPMKQPMSYMETTAPVTPIRRERRSINQAVAIHEFCGFIKSFHRWSATIIPITP